MIDPAFYSEPDDLDDMLRGLRLARRILEAPAWDRVRGAEIRPGPAVQTDDALKDYIRASSADLLPPGRHLRDGQECRTTSSMRSCGVRGVDGLRVVDASIIPRMIGGNTNAPVIMIAEKAADMIRGRAPLPADQGV